MKKDSVLCPLHTDHLENVRLRYNLGSLSERLSLHSVHMEHVTELRDSLDMIENQDDVYAEYTMLVSAGIFPPFFVVSIR